MKCEFIEDCPHAKQYVGRVCLLKAELCKTRSEIARKKELEAVFTDKGYQVGGNTIQVFKYQNLMTIKIKWYNGKTTILSAKEVSDKAWRKSTFPYYIKNLLESIGDGSVQRDKPTA